MELDACNFLNGKEYPSPRDVIDNVQANVIENENEAEEFQDKLEGFDRVKGVNLRPEPSMLRHKGLVKPKEEPKKIKILKTKSEMPLHLRVRDALDDTCVGSCKRDVPIEYRNERFKLMELKKEERKPKNAQTFSEVPNEKLIEQKKKEKKPEKP